MSASSISRLATFGCGCFWGTEHLFRKHFKDALVSTAVGYMGGDVLNPTYKDICTGKSGHAEVLHLEFNPQKVSYSDLIEYFFRIHDATTVNQQGDDKGTQYRSVIFYYDDTQRQIANEVIIKLKDRYKDPIVTEVVAASGHKFYPAEDDHQLYLERNPSGYCNHVERW